MSRLSILAHHYMVRGHDENTLQTTAPANDAHLRLIGVDGFTWQNRMRLFAISAMLIRRLLRTSCARPATGNGKGSDES